MNLNPSGALPATAAKSGGSHRGSGKSSKRMDLDFKAFLNEQDDLDVEFGIDDDGGDDATTVRPRHELAGAAQPKSSDGAALSKPLSSSATGFVAPVSNIGAPPASSGANAAEPFADGSAEHVAGNISATHGSTQAAASKVDVPRSEIETLATVDRLPQTEVVDTQMLEDVPALQMTAPVVQLPPPPAAELPLAPDELMQEAQELVQPPTTMPAAGKGDGATLPHSMMSSDERVELAVSALTVTPAAPTVEEEDHVATVAPKERNWSPPIEPASGVTTLGAVQDAEPDQVEAQQPSATLSAFDLASPLMRAPLLRPFEFAATASGQQSPEQLAVTSAPAPLPVQPPPSGPEQRPARVEQRVEPVAENHAEPALQDAAAPQADARRSLDKMSAELKQLMSDARGQQLRTQLLLNNIMMLASPIHHHKLVERQKKVEEEHQALVAMEQELEPQ